MLERVTSELRIDEREKLEDSATFARKQTTRARAHGAVYRGLKIRNRSFLVDYL